MKKLRKSRASKAAFLLAFLALISIAKVHVVDKITSDSSGEVSLKPEDLVRSDKIGIESSSSKNDGVQDASALVVDTDFMKEQNHNNKQEDEINDEKENDPIPNLTEITADHTETELHGTEMSTDEGTTSIEVHDDDNQENDPIPNLTEITDNHIETEIDGTAASEVLAEPKSQSSSDNESVDPVDPQEEVSTQDDLIAIPELLSSNSLDIESHSAINDSATMDSFSAAVFLQVGYADLWDEMLQCATNVVNGAAVEKYHKVDVFVSVVEATPPNQNSSNQRRDRSLQEERSNELTVLELEAKINSDLKSIAHVGEVVVKQFENEGADIGSFLKMLEHDNISSRDYDAVLKMHTKGDSIWRERGIESLCGTPAQAISIFNHFRADEDLDMIVPQGLLFGPNTPPTEIFPHVVKKYNLTGPPKAAFDPETQTLMNTVHREMFSDDEMSNDETGSRRDISENEMMIAAGTMFWIRYPALNPQRLVNALPKLKFGQGYNENLEVEHALERIFATEIVMSDRGKIAEITPAPRPVAMYFPQYHSIPENDRFWGKGFTEWTLLKPLELEGIRKPLPVEEGGLGFYDLMSKDTRKKQAQFANAAGVNGFIYYHYWFSGSHAPDDHLVMYKVQEKILEDGEPNLPFAFSWANEPWTKRWTGTANTTEDTLLSQDYGDEEEWREHFDYLLKFFKHPNYIRVQGKPMFILYRIGHIGSHLEPMVKLWRELALEAGLPGLHIVNTIGNFRIIDENTSQIEKDADLDASFHFWPQLHGSKIRLLDLGSIHSSANDIAALLQTYPTQYWGAYTGFDRRPRDKNVGQGQHVSVEQFDKTLACSFEGMSAKNSREIGKNYYFMTAWNEWNEQAILEPDNENGFGYLDAINLRLRNVPISTVWPIDEREVGSRKREAFLRTCLQRPKKMM